jgi:hypothetical protein
MKLYANLDYSNYVIIHDKSIKCSINIYQQQPRSFFCRKKYQEKLLCGKLRLKRKYSEKFSLPTKTKTEVIKEKCLESSSNHAFFFLFTLTKKILKVEIKAKEANNRNINHK